jgi:hypothetical protein
MLTGCASGGKCLFAAGACVVTRPPDWPGDPCGLEESLGYGHTCLCPQGIRGRSAVAARRMVKHAGGQSPHARKRITSDRECGQYRRKRLWSARHCWMRRQRRPHQSGIVSRGCGHPRPGLECRQTDGLQWQRESCRSTRAAPARPILPDRSTDCDSISDDATSPTHRPAPLLRSARHRGGRGCATASR